MKTRFKHITLAIALPALLLGGPACDSGDGSKPTGGAARQPQALPPDVAEGLQIFNRLGCGVCHSFEGKALAGPDLANIDGKEVKLVDGTTMVRDEAYMRDSILDSGKHVVDGYRPTMINYGSMLQDGELDKLLALIRHHTD